ncbi:MAG: glycosyltransferase family 4 protein [Minwuia sp.]|uniref:glycosyltransferase family 4 protein n=1 Tax=Minwuia sp. TaxID=2493630 RepID=UPI003A889E52
MKIALVTDAWLPQVNGVVRTWGRVVEECERLGHEVLVIAPRDFRTVPLPTYSEIRIAVGAGRKVRRMLDEFAPDAVHVATEGPLGLAARRHCLKLGWPFTTSYHTKFPEYVSARFPVPLSWGYAAVRRFHRPSSAVLVATPTIRRELEAEGFANIADWTRGVDTDLFRPDGPKAWEGEGPLFLYVGRVAVEKNIGQFLDLDLPGTKAVVGGGPQLDELRRDHPDVLFPGPKFGEELASWYRSASVFVFPSRTDTFGLVLLESLASGVPVAALPVPGPLDVVGRDGPGVLDEDLGKAALEALTIDPAVCRKHAMRFSWEATAAIFLQNLARIERTPPWTKP